MSVIIEEVCRFSDFLKLKNEWNTLHTLSVQSDDLFLTHEWFDSWWQGFGEGKSLFILLLKDGTELVAIAPFMKFNRKIMGVPIRVIGLMTNEHTTRADFIIKRNCFEMISTVMAYLNQFRAEWDLIELNFLPSTSPTVKAITEQATKFGFEHVLKPLNRSPYIPINGNWDDFYMGLKGHFRRNLKNREKRLNKLGSIKLERFTGNGSLELCLEEVFEVGSKSWKEQDGTAIASTQQSRRFYERLAQNTSERGWLNISLLRLNNKPIAFHYSLKYCNQLLLLKTEYDLEYKAYSPGHLIQKDVLKQCFLERLREFDFLGQTMLWKRDWTHWERSHVQALIFNNKARSRILTQIEMRVKPFLRQYAFVEKVYKAIQNQ